MGHSKATKAGSHDRIVQAAAARVRENGVEGIGVADLMKDAGLTHGGFYRHFASREELVAEAIERALHEGAEAVAAVANITECPVAALVDAYLSTSAPRRIGDKLCRHDVGGRRGPQQRPGAVRLYTAGWHVFGTPRQADRRQPTAIDKDEGNCCVVHVGRRRIDGPCGERRKALS